MIYICNDKSDYKKCFDEILIYKNMKYWNNITNISFEEQMKKYLEIYNTYR